MDLGRYMRGLMRLIGFTCGDGWGSTGEEAAISLVLKEVTGTELVELADILGEYRTKGKTVYIKVNPLQNLLSAT